MNEEQKPVTADEIGLGGVAKIFGQRICNMLRKHEIMWIAWLGPINVSEPAIDVKDGAKTFTSAPYRSRMTAREHESFKLS